MSSINDDPIDRGGGLAESKQDAINEKATPVGLAAPGELKVSDEKLGESDSASIIIVTGADVSAHLMSLRDDFDRTLTLRSIVVASGLACFNAVISQIYQFKQSSVGVSGAFIVLISYFVGNAWAEFLPRGDKLEARWIERGGQGRIPRWISFLKLVNCGPWSLKEHAICAITAGSATNASAATNVFAAQYLFYDLPLSSVTVILSTISIGLFGYGICGFLRPIAIWHVESVYWQNLASYPDAYRYYHNHCQTYRYGITNHTIPNIQAGDEGTIKVRLPLGTALVIPPQPGDCRGGRKGHWIACLFTSCNYGRRVDPPDMIINSTHAALQDLKSQLDSLRSDCQDSQETPSGELWSCRFNSGLFGVPWQKTRGLVEDVGLDLTVVYPAEGIQENDGKEDS